MQFDVDINSKFADLFLKVRETLLSFEEIRELKNAKQTSYYDEYSSICFMRTRPKGLTIAFGNGAKLNELFPILEGSQKIVRHLYVASIDEFDEGLMRRLIEESLILNIEKDAIKAMLQ